jgi:uncharacterized membrane protein YfcA
LALIALARWLLVWTTLTFATSVAEAATASGTDAQLAYDSHNYDLARHIWTTLAEAGDAQAQFALGIIYDLGNGVAQDQAEAYRWYRRAAAAGLPSAEFNVAVMADSGRGVSRDPTVAALWYAKAAAHGHHRAQYNLGQLYETGDGVPCNPDQAVAWYEAAAGGGLKAASERRRIAKTRQASRPANLAGTLAPPMLIAPADHAEIEATVDPASIELVWNAPPQPVPTKFFFEVFRVDHGSLHKVFDGYTDRSAVLTPAEFDPNVYVWRVYAVDQATLHYTMSQWQLFTIKQATTTIGEVAGDLGAPNRATGMVAAAHHHLDPPKAMLVRAILGLPLLAVLGLLTILILGGSTKGALGIGLPIISVPLAAQFLDLPLAIGLLAVPMVSTNIAQAFESGGTMPALRRLWPTISALVLGTLAGAHILISIDRHMLDAIVGVSLVLIAALMLCQPKIRFAPSAEQWGGPLVGLSAGLLGGMSGMFGPPLVAYLVGLDLHPDAFVKQISILFLAATGTLLLALGSMGGLSTTDLLISAAAMIPIQLGLIIGRRLRRRIQPAIFRGAVLSVLAAGGIGLLRQAFI